MVAELRPIISYYGGKQRIAIHILKLVSSIHHNVYCEPFFGGGAVFFGKPKRVMSNNSSYREVINDTNENLINMYRVCQTRKEELLELLEYTAYSESEYKKAKEIYNNPVDYDELWRAWAVIVNASQSFARQLNAGWGYDRRRTNCAKTWSNHKKRLPKILDRLDGVFISCRDALLCIDNWDSKETLFYCDPPYINTNQGHYSGYTEDDFKKLVDKLSSIQGSFILSCYPNDIVPKEWDCIKIKAVMSATKVTEGDRRKDKERTECIWYRNNGHKYSGLPLFN